MYQRHKNSWTKHLDFMILDLVCMNIGYLVAYTMRHGYDRSPFDSEMYLGILLCMCLCNVMIAIGASTYKNVLKRGYLIEIGATLRQVALVILFTIGYLFVIKSGDAASRFVILFSGVIYMFLALITRLLWKEFLRNRMEKDKSRSLLIVTTSDRAETVVGQMQSTGYNLYHIAGLVLLDQECVISENTASENAASESTISETIDFTNTSDENAEGLQKESVTADEEKAGSSAATDRVVRGVRVVATRENAAEYVCREWIDEVLIDMPSIEETPQDLLDKFMEMGVVVHITITGIINPYGQSQFMERIGGMTVLTSSIRSVDSSRMIIKRLVDICVGLIGTILCVLFTIIFGPLIFIASPGPIFFKQVRVGKSGKKFKMYKFRSMYLDAEERKKELLEQNNVKDGMMFKLDYDPRIIGCKKRPDGTIKKGIGNFIRDWSIDEFPQCINILKGDMSAVGTRPPTVDEWEKYELHHRQRLAIKPGLTGMWQISGRSDITDFEEVVRLDAEYIADWSLAKDLKILFKTVSVVLRRAGAK